jgi:hypothetical protein
VAIPRRFWPIHKSKPPLGKISSVSFSFLPNTHLCYSQSSLWDVIHFSSRKISFALQYEKSGLASIEQAEESYSKAASAISDALSIQGIYYLSICDNILFSRGSAE